MEGGKYFFHIKLPPSSQHLYQDAHSSHLQQTAWLDLTGGVMERGSVRHSLCCSIAGKGDLPQSQPCFVL